MCINPHLSVTYLPWTGLRLWSHAGKAPQASTELTWLLSPGTAISWNTRTVEGRALQTGVKSCRHGETRKSTEARKPEGIRMHTYTLKLY